jgi:hypothetical protein
MTITEQVLQLPKEKKLRVMEALWEDLSSKDAFESPSWHGEKLRETQERLDRGEEEAVSWEEAKDRLKK